MKTTSPLVFTARIIRMVGSKSRCTGFWKDFLLGNLIHGPCIQVSNMICGVLSVYPAASGHAL